MSTTVCLARDQRDAIHHEALGAFRAILDQLEASR